MKTPGRRLAGVLALSVLVSGWATVQPAAAAPGHEVTVLGTDADLATFTSAKCRKVRGGFKALTPRSENGYRLSVTIDDFHGFGKYDVVPGRDADPYISVSHAGTSFSNLFEPPFPAPGYGLIQFSRNHKLLGVGYTPAWNLDGTDAVTLTGALVCHYPGTKR